MDWRGDLGEDMMAAERVGGHLVAEAWAERRIRYRIVRVSKLCTLWGGERVWTVNVSFWCLRRCT